jgi:hypothetical protein
MASIAPTNRWNNRRVCSDLPLLRSFLSWETLNYANRRGAKSAQRVISELLALLALPHTGISKEPEPRGTNAVRIAEIRAKTAAWAP